MFAEKLYACLLRLYPAAFREEYERELRAAFRKRWREERSITRRTGLGTAIFVDTLATALGEHAAMFYQDVRYTLRTLRKSRSFTAAVVATLALGIGATTTMYSLAHTVLLRPYPFPRLEELVRIWETNPSLNTPFFATSLLNFLSWEERSRAFAGLAAFGQSGVNLTGDGEPQRVNAWSVTADFWRVTGLVPILGRAFSAEEHVPGRDEVTMLSEGLWQSRYGRDPSVIGRRILVDGTARTIIGIAPHDTGLRGEVNMWLPMAPNPAVEDRGNHLLTVIARMKPGIGMEQANAELNTIAEALDREFPVSNKGWRVRMAPIQDWIVDAESRTNLYALLGAAGLLLLVACSNVASLLVTRATGRQHELGVRMALGASRARLARQLTTESVVLASIGGALGIVLAWGAVGWLAAIVPSQLPRTASLQMNWPVTLFGLGLTLAVGLLFGLAPAWLVRRPGIQPTLGQSARGSTAVGAARLRLGFIGTQIALAAMLLVGALLLIQSFARLQKIDLGFPTDHLLSARIRLPEGQYESLDAAPVYFRTLVEELRNQPGVVSAGVSNAVPLGSPNTSMSVVPVNRPPGVPERGFQALWRTASVGYLETLDVPLLRGRFFEPADLGRDAMILSERLARSLWPDGSDPVGRTVRLSNGSVYTIVGIAGDVRHAQLNAEPVGTMYFGSYYMRASTILVRTKGDPAAFAPALRQVIYKLDPQQPVDFIRTMEGIIEQNTERPYLQATLFGGFALMALLLGAIGVAGIVAYTVERRTQDLAIRLALGATPGHAMRSAAAGGLTAAAIGLAIGLAGAWALGSYLSTLLYQLQPHDLPTFAAVAGVLMGVAALACWLPARRVARIDPIVALRLE